jgi:hypothetical protein
VAVVLVWLPSRSATGSINVGHAALLADRAVKPAYVSWWPDGGVNKSQTDTSGHINNSFENDVRSEDGQQPISVDLPGLADQMIADWWDRVKDTGFGAPYSLEVLPKSNNYDLYVNNCATIVFRAMIIGGAMQSVPFPKFDTITPPHILTWAKMIAAKEGVTGWFKSLSNTFL